MIYPPRPESCVMREELERFERLGHIWQYKLNGTCSVQETKGHGVVEAYTRHQTPHRLWTPETSKALAPLRDLPEGFILVGELMHSKVQGGPRDTLYLHDLVQDPREDMWGETYQDRYQRLLDLLGPEDRGDEDHLVVSPNLWVARNLTSEFRKRFDGIRSTIHEGGVLKNPLGKLKHCSTPKANAGWQVKCRVPHANYSF